MKIFKPHKPIIFFVILSNFVYLYWRLFFTLPSGVHWFIFLLALSLWLSEFSSIFTAMILFWSKSKRLDLEMPHIPDEEYPKLDVFIATHNESEDLLYKTINGCKNMDYPDKNKVRIHLCDDKERETMRALAQETGINYIGLSDNKHAKSGNLNNALSKTHAPLIVTFDADMIPHSNFLIRSIPYFFLPFYEKDDHGNWVKRQEALDQKIGFIQTPQRFYNPDLFHYNLFAEGKIPNEQDFFSREVNVANNAHNAAVYTGSNTVLSRAAIIEAGGFPTNTITEDFQLGVSIQEQGYQCYATSEVLSGGLTPNDFNAVLKQRKRWARGVIRSYYNLRIPFTSKLSMGQKLIYTSTYLYWWSFCRRIIYIFAPILFALFDIRLVDNNYWLLLVFWIPAYFSMNWYMGYLAGNIRTQRWGEIYETIMAPFMIIPVFLESIGIRARKFIVTKKTQTNDGQFRYILPHAIMLILLIASLIKFNYGKYGSELLYGSVINFWLLHHFINVSFAFLFFFRRKLYRASERFNAQFKCQIYLGEDFYIEAQGIDISDGGLAVASKIPLFIPTDQTLTLKINSGIYSSSFEAGLKRVGKKDDQYIYSFQNEKITSHELSDYDQIIYNQMNENLPLKRDPWYTEFDVILNILKAKFTFNKRSPVLNPVRHYIELDPKQTEPHLLRFDSRYLYFDFDSSQRRILRALTLNGKSYPIIYVGIAQINHKTNLVYRFEEDLDLDFEELEVHQLEIID